MILIKHPVHINTLSMKLSNLYFNGLLIKISIQWCTSVSEDCFLPKANSADPDEMRLMRCFIWFLTVCKSTCLSVCRMTRVQAGHLCNQYYFLTSWFNYLLTSFLSLLKCELNVSDTLYFQMYALLNDTLSAKISIFRHNN